MAEQPGVLALVSDDWPVAPQRRHQILTRLATRFPVAWISPPRHWRERPRRSDELPRRGQTNEDSHMLVLGSAYGIPTVNHPRFVRDAIVRDRVKQGAAWLRHRGCDGIELQIWNPDFASALDWLPGASTSYHVDDEYSWSTLARPLSGSERRVIERVERVYVTSRRLLETKGGINPNTTFSSNGADYRAFSTTAPEPSDLSRISRPRVGYVGVLKEQLDLDLLIALAAAHASWAFVFVGPVRAVHASLRDPLARLRALPNVHLMGERSPEALPGYLQHIDVALLPYRRNAYTDCINPMKLYEALASGTPIVGSRIRTLEDFRAVISLAEGVGEWSAGIDRVLSDQTRSIAQREARQSIARAHDWDAITAPIAESIARRWGLHHETGILG